MSVELPMQDFGKRAEQPYIIFQNNYGKFGTGRVKSWVKMQLDGTILEDKKPIFTEYEMNLLKQWIDVNKLPILLHWTQEKTDLKEIIEMIKPVNAIKAKNI